MATRSTTNRARLRLVETPPSAPSGAASATSTPVAIAAAAHNAYEAPAFADDAIPPPVASGPHSVCGPVPVAPAPRWNTASGRAQLASLNDGQLVALACGERSEHGTGGTAALEILYRRHAAYAIHLATRIEGSSRDVEDIVHDAFLRAFERLGDLSDRGAFKSWLGAIVVHAVRSRMRRGRLMSLLGMGKGAEPVDLDALASPDASPHTRAQLAQIYALLLTLATDDRIAWTLRCVEGHDLETVARLTRCSLATVKRRITKVQRFLDQHFVDVSPDVAPGVAPDADLSFEAAPPERVSPDSVPRFKDVLS